MSQSGQTVLYGAPSLMRERILFIKQILSYRRKSDDNNNHSRPLYTANHVPGTVLDTLSCINFSHPQSYLLRSVLLLSHFKNEETEGLRGDVTCPQVVTYLESSRAGFNARY